jgi:hypothetical protein
MKNIHKINENIYITSDEEINVGTFVLDIKNNEVVKSKGKMSKNPYIKKIILTDNKDLIKDGVQAIDDEFLEWFVKNPSCEEVEVIYTNCANCVKIQGQELSPDCCHNYQYKIIIPQEEAKQDRTCTNNCSVVCGECQIFEPKQETLEEPTMIDDWLNEYGDPEIYKKVEKQLELEEAAERYSLELLEAKTIQHHEKTWIKSMFIHIAKWQQERMYSEEEVQVKLYECLGHFAQKHNIIIEGIEIDQWFEQFKKK